MTNDSFKKAVRLRMAETGDKYTTALRYLEAHPEEFQRLKARMIALRLARKAARDEGEGSGPDVE